MSFVVSPFRWRETRTNDGERWSPNWQERIWQRRTSQPLIEQVRPVRRRCGALGCTLEFRLADTELGSTVGPVHAHFIKNVENCGHRRLDGGVGVGLGYEEAILYGSDERAFD